MKQKLAFIIAMFVFGTIGLFVKGLTLDSVSVVQWRAIIGSISLLLIIAIQRKKLDMVAVKQNKIPLLLSGIVLGANWVFLFEAYRYTSIGMATILYYCAPILVFFLAIPLFKEKPSVMQYVGILAAIAGMVLVNFEGLTSLSFSIGIGYGLLSALFYAMVIILNKYIRGMTGIDSTVIQLLTAAIVLTIYHYISIGTVISPVSGGDLIRILILGVFYTGIIYAVYFGSVQKLPSQDVAVLSYIDPASALLFAYLFLGESLGMIELLGAVLIFGGSLFAQLKVRKSRI